MFKPHSLSHIECYQFKHELMSDMSDYIYTRVVGLFLSEIKQC